MDHPFRSAAFGGFNRQDVLDYLEKTAAENARKKQELQQRLEEAEEDRRKLASQESDQEERVTILNRDRESLSQQLDKSSKRLNTVLYISLSSPGQMSSRVIYTWIRPLESCNSMKEAFPMTRRLMMRPATDTWRGSASSLNSFLISVEKALVTYSAAG